MKTHTLLFKKEIKEFGRQQDVQIIANNTTLTSEDINEVQYWYEGSLLKSIMTGLDIDSNISLEEGTVLKLKYGMWIEDNQEYEYIDYVDFIVRSCEYQADTYSYKIECNDYLINSMKDYETVDIEFPATVKEYLTAVCKKIGIEFANGNDTFCNCNRLISTELYKDIGYTYRDVLDEFAQVTGSAICMNLDNKLEVRYINENATYTNIAVERDATFNAQNALIKNLVIQGKSTQNGTPSPDSPAEIESVSGKNLFDLSTISEKTYLTSSDGSTGTSSVSNVSDYIEVKANKTYILNFDYESLANSNNRAYCFYDENKNFLSGGDYYPPNKKAIITPTTDGYIRFGYDINCNNVQFQRGSTVTDYVPHNHIAIRSTNKNLLNEPSSLTVATVKANVQLNVKAGTYVLSVENIETTGTTASLVSFNLADGTRGYYYLSNSSKSKTVTFNSDVTSYNIYSQNSYNASIDVTAVFTNLMLRQESTSAEYEPHVSNQVNIPLLHPLRSLPNKIYDRIYKKDDKWYDEQKVKRVVYNGTETGWTYSSAQDRDNIVYFQRVLDDASERYGFNTVPLMCNRLINRPVYYPDQEGIFLQSSNGVLMVRLNKSRLSEISLAGFLAWLAENNLEVQYELHNVITTKVTDAETLYELNHMRTLQGENNMTTDAPIEFDYATEREEFDEEYFDEANVEFGEKYGPINSVVLSRAAESDNVYMQDEQSIENNGLCEIKIKENQIMNFDDRSEYLPELFSVLSGVEYYINDVTSTGIMYLDILDKYNVKIEDKVYDCLMINDQQNISQGLEELIYTKSVDGSKTDYTKADKTDRALTKATIIADKQNAEIEALTATTNELRIQTNNNSKEINNNYQAILQEFNNYVPQNSFVTMENSVRQLQTDTYTKTQIDTKLTDGSVTMVKSTIALLNDAGFTIEKSGAPTKSNMDANGWTIKDTTSGTEENLLEAIYDNNIGETLVRAKNMYATKYLVAGQNARIEDYTRNRTGVFYVGG